MSGVDNIGAKAKVIWRWCKLWGGASSLGSGPVMSTVSTDGVEDTGESIEIESGDDHT